MKFRGRHFIPETRFRVLLVTNFDKVFLIDKFVAISNKAKENPFLPEF